MESFILDTNLFFNIEAGIGFGKKTEEVVVNMTKMIRKLKKEKKALFLMPPTIVSEFLSFFKDKEQLFIKDFLSLIIIKSPDKSKITLSATIFNKLVEDVRERSYRGLNIGEEEIIRAGNLMLGVKEMNKKDFQIKIGSVVKTFRDRYRNATRTGFLDSIADLDLILLSIEQGGYLVSADEGVLKWGRYFGVKEMPASIFQKQLEGLLG